MYHKVGENEKIKYIDFTSLYSYVNKYSKYISSHPEIITQVAPDAKISDFFGLAHVRVRPPRKLLHPVLPVKMDDKLLFPLCRTCAERREQKTCTHTDSERELTGVWCTPELLEAERQNYEIVKKIAKLRIE